jgi:competence protein ComEC
MVSDERRLTEACDSADIILSTVDIFGRCHGPRLVIDRRAAWGEGAQAIWLSESGLKRDTGNGVRGDRPWVPNSSWRRTASLKPPGT